MKLGRRENHGEYKNDSLLLALLDRVFDLGGINVN